MVARITPKGGKPAKHFFREWRKFRKMSQEQVAEAMDTTKATISRMETGKTQYNADYLQALAQALGIQAPDLFRSPEARSSIDRMLDEFPPELADEADLIREDFKRQLAERKAMIERIRHAR